MFLGNLISTLLVAAVLFHGFCVRAQQAAPSLDLFESAPKKPTAKPAAKSPAKRTTKAVVKKPVTKPTAKPTAKSKPVVKAPEKKMPTPQPPSVPMPTSRIAPQPSTPEPVNPPPLPPTSVTAPTAPSTGRTARRVVVRPRSEFERRIGLGYATWREPLTYAVGNSTRGGKASFAGFLLRYEMSKKSSPVNWGGSASFFYGAADAKSNDSSSYRVNKVGAQGLIASPFAFFEPMPEVQVKIALDITYKILSWPSTVGAYDVRTKPLTYGPNVGIEYRIWNQWLVEQKIGSYSPEGDVYWSVGATYKLP